MALPEVSNYVSLHLYFDRPFSWLSWTCLYDLSLSSCLDGLASAPSLLITVSQMNPTEVPFGKARLRACLLPSTYGFFLFCLLFLKGLPRQRFVIPPSSKPLLCARSPTFHAFPINSASASPASLVDPLVSWESSLIRFCVASFSTRMCFGSKLQILDTTTAIF